MATHILNSDTGRHEMQAEGTGAPVIAEPTESHKITAETVLKGGKTNYYLVWVQHPQREEQPPYQAECEDIIEALGLTFNEANIFKEIWRSANARTHGNGKPGHASLYGAQKMVHYASRILRKYEHETKNG